MRPEKWTLPAASARAQEDLDKSHVRGVVTAGAYGTEEGKKAGDGCWWDLPQVVGGPVLPASLGASKDDISRDDVSDRIRSGSSVEVGRRNTT